LVLNRLIPHNSILMNRVEFIGHSLFIPFFLIFVGMVVDYRAFFQGTWPLIIAGVLTSFALLSKWLAAYFTQVIFKMRATERQLIFGLSASHAAATLAIIMVGYNEGKGILDINIVNGTVLLILITCMVASFVTENAGKRMLIEQAESTEQTEENPLRNKHLMVAMNELNGNESLLDFALLISDPKVINPISVVSVYPNDNDAEHMIRKSRKSLEDIVKHFSGHEAKLNTMATIDHNVSSGIARVAKELVSDMVVINDSSSKNWIRRIVGDDRDHLLDVCDRAIIFCQLDKPFVSYHKIKVICPKMADLEASFGLWAERVLRFAVQLNIDIDLFSTVQVHEKWLKISEANRLMPSLKLFEMEDLDDYFLLNKSHGSNELIVFSSARPGGVSYQTGIESFPSKLEKAHEQNDRLLIFPAQQGLENMYSNYEGFDATPISKGVEAIQRLGKEVGSIFKKQQE
jgi:hypothetical protein